MTPGQRDGPRRSQPDQRALGAMESAVQRARASQGLRRPPIGSGAPSGPPMATPPNQPRPPKFVDDGAERRSKRWLPATVALVAVLVVGSGIAFTVSTSRRSSRSSPTAAPVRQPVRTGKTSTTTSTTTTTTASPSSGSAPQISTLTPASGSPGQTVTVTGSNFLSSDGRIVASFDGQVTATSCSTQDVCLVTVPPPPVGETSALVTITTASGTSNPINFSYP
jgi:hypothetical protein